MKSRGLGQADGVTAAAATMGRSASLGDVATAAPSSSSSNYGLDRGAKVYVDLYMRRVPAEVRREMQARRLYKIRVRCMQLRLQVAVCHAIDEHCHGCLQVVPSDEAEDLGGVTSLVDVANMYFKTEHGTFVPVLQLANRPMAAQVPKPAFRVSHEYIVLGHSLSANTRLRADRWKEL